MSKAKVAFFDFTSCEGCQIELTNYGDEAFLALLEHIEIVEFREAMTEKAKEPLDIAFIEGSFSRESERGRLEEIRNRSEVVIAYGACAVTGGVNALKNHTSDYLEEVYGKDANRAHLCSQKARPISDAIKVDHTVPGCPIDRAELINIISQLLHGTTPTLPTHPVCVECKFNQTICRYHNGEHCLGLVARAGCGAPCPAHGIPCEACRGFVPNAQEDTLKDVLMEKGNLSEYRAESLSRMFTANERSDAQ